MIQIECPIKLQIRARERECIIAATVCTSDGEAIFDMCSFNLQMAHHDPDIYDLWLEGVYECFKRWVEKMIGAKVDRVDVYRQSELN